MRRVDYAEPTLGARLATLRRPLGVALATLVAIGAAHGIERVRASALRASVAAASADAALWESRAAELRTIEAERDRLRVRVRERERIVRSGERRAAELAALGNAIPASAWLSSVRIDPSGYAIDARAGSLAAIAATVAALSRLSAVAAVRLLAAREDGRAGIAYTLAVERRR